jgi:HEAT repeat protein
MVLGIFSKEGAIKRAIKTTQNKFAQHDDRMSAMQKLRDAGTDEALLALCRRFSFVYDKSIQDTDEKDWVVETLTQKGDAALKPLSEYMKSALSLGYPLMALSRIANGEKALPYIDAILAAEKPGYTRDPNRRIDVIEWLAEWDGVSPDMIAERIIPYLEDFDSNTRFKAIEALAQKPSKKSAEPLCKVVVNPDEENARIVIRAAEVLAAQEHDLGSYLPQISELLESKLTGFRLHRDRLQKK